MEKFFGLVFILVCAVIAVAFVLSIFDAGGVIVAIRHMIHVIQNPIPTSFVGLIC